MLVVVALLAFGHTAHASSTVWNTTISGAVGICDSTGPNCTGDLTTFGFNNPNISIQYRAFIKDADTGEIIPPGGSVPVGTHLKLVFDKHVSEDIYWFGTGSFLDSPYGDWGNPDIVPPVQCLEKDFLETSKWLYYSANGGDIQYKNYVPFIVREPVKNISGNDTSLLSCGALNGSEQDCTARAVGNIPLLFNFDTTVGKFYARWITFGRDVTKHGGGTVGECGGAKSALQIKRGGYWPGQTEWGASSWRTFYGNGTGSDHVEIGTESIPYPITIVPPVGAPEEPTVTSTSCTVGTSLELAFTSTDPNGHRLRFGVDWDDDGMVDQFVPPSGYVPSGSEQSAKRTFAIPGEKHVAVMVENDRGARSEWTHYSFNCAEDNNNNNPPSPQQCSIGYVYQDGACVFTSCPVGYVKQGNACVFQDCPVGYTLQNGACVWSGCPEGFIQQGNQCILENQCTSFPYCSGNDLRNGCTHELIQVCQWGCVSGACSGVPAPSAALSATPAIVIKGKTTKLSWNSANTTSCTVTGTNGDSFTGLSAINKLSGPLNVTSIFTLRCEGHEGSSPAYVEKKVTVTVRADWSEE